MRRDGTTPYARQDEWVAGRRVRVPAHERIKVKELVASTRGMLDGARVRTDGWMNAFTGVGDPTRDKMHLGNSSLLLDTISQLDAEIIWRSDYLAAKAIEKIPEEMTRQGWRLQVEDEDGKTGKDIAEAMERWAEDFDVTGKAKEGLEYARGYGGAGIMLGADDGEKDWTKPLRLDKIRFFRWANVLTPLELFPRIWYGDPHAPKYGEPMIYRVQRFVFGGAVETGFSEKILEMPLVHESRIIRIDGIRVSRRHMRERNGWGDSVLMRMLQIISDFQQAYRGAAILTSDFAQAVFKIKDLADLMSSQNKDDVTARAQLIDMSRSIARAVIIDSEEEFERKGTPVAGLDKLLEQLTFQLASVIDMPVSLLMGQSPAGLNATGDADIRWFYDRVKNLQQRKLIPIIKRILQCAFNSKEGPTGGVEPKNWAVVPNPLWQLTALEEADRRLKIAQADVAYVGAQVLSPEEVAATRFGGDEYDGENMTVDLESRRAIQTLAPEAPRPGPVDGVTRPPAPMVPEGERGAKEPNENAPVGSGALGMKENPPNPGSTNGEGA